MATRFRLSLRAAPAARFFPSLLPSNTREGHLADPMYGGSRAMAAWKLRSGEMAAGVPHIDAAGEQVDQPAAMVVRARMDLSSLPVASRPRYQGGH
jgi:hypothetical protein